MLERGHEYGTTTGRERRCGWMDLVALRYAVRLNRMSALTITKLDVLSGLDPLRVAVRYRSREGAVFDRFPYHQSILHSAVPEYEELPGFDGRPRRLPQRGRPAAAGPRLPRLHRRVRRRPDPARRRRPRSRPGDLDRRRARAARRLTERLKPLYSRRWLPVDAQLRRASDCQGVVTGYRGRR